VVWEGWRREAPPYPDLGRETEVIGRDRNGGLLNEREAKQKLIIARRSAAVDPLRTVALCPSNGSKAPTADHPLSG